MAPSPFLLHTPWKRGCKADSALVIFSLNNIHFFVVSRMLNGFQNNWNFSRDHAGGRTGATCSTKTDFQSYINACGIRISTQTVRNHLHDAELRAHKGSFNCPPYSKSVCPPYSKSVKLDHNSQDPDYLWLGTSFFINKYRFCLDFTIRHVVVAQWVITGS